MIESDATSIACARCVPAIVVGQDDHRGVPRCRQQLADLSSPIQALGVRGRIRQGHGQKGGHQDESPLVQDLAQLPR